MEKQIFVCEKCGKIAQDQKQLRKENWLMISGGILKGIEIWLDKPRKHKEGVSDSFMIHIGWKERDYHFCSIKCLVKLLKANESF